MSDVGQSKAASSSDEESVSSPDSIKLLNKRRISVSGTSYDPSKDFDMETIDTFPKTDEQQRKIREDIKEIFLFRSLDEAQLDKVIDATFIRPVEEGEVIIQQGRKGDNFYIIDTGCYDAYISVNGEEPKLKTSYESRGYFGELALMYDVPRAATVKARTAGFLWVLPGDVFRRLVLKSVYEKRCRYEGLIKGVPVLSALSSYEVANVCDALMPMAFAPGQYIMHQGDKADGMYFVEDGELVITITNDQASEEKELARLQSGDHFGEMALVNKAPRSANVRAVTKVKLAFLDTEAFERLLGPCVNYMKEDIESYTQPNEAS